MKNIKYDSFFTDAIKDKLKKLNFPLGYLHQSNHPNVKDIADTFPCNGATIGRILTPKKSLISDNSLYKIMEWCGIRSIQLSYDDDNATTLKTINLK